MKLTFLGTGTSQGVPVIGCHCAVCRSADRRDSRLRTAAMVEHEGKRIVIDAGPFCLSYNIGVSLSWEMLLARERRVL